MIIVGRDMATGKSVECSTSALLLMAAVSPIKIISSYSSDGDVLPLPHVKKEIISEAKSKNVNLSIKHLGAGWWQFLVVSPLTPTPQHATT